MAQVLSAAVSLLDSSVALDIGAVSTTVEDHSLLLDDDLLLLRDLPLRLLVHVGLLRINALLLVGSSMHV